MSASPLDKAISGIAISSIALTLFGPFDAYAITKAVTPAPPVAIDAATKPIKYVEEIVYDNFVIQKKVLLDKKTAVSSSISGIKKEVDKANSLFQNELNQLNEVNNKLKNSKLDSSTKSSLNGLKNECSKKVNTALAAKKNKAGLLERAESDLETLNKQIKQNEESINKSSKELKAKKEKRIKREKEEAEKTDLKLRDRKKLLKEANVRKASAVVGKEQSELERIEKDEASYAEKIKGLMVQEKKTKAAVGKVAEKIKVVDIEYQSLKASLEREEKALNEIAQRLDGARASSAADKEAIAGLKGALEAAKKSLQAIQNTKI